jgi:hypothetical protein
VCPEGPAPKCWKLEGGEERATLRGLATGKVRLHEADTNLKGCVVFGGKFPTWLPILRQLGLRAVLVFWDDDQAFNAAEALVDCSCVILCWKKWDVYGSSLPEFTNRSMMGFVDG